MGATAATAVGLSGRHSDAARLHGAPAADVGNVEHTITLQNRTDSRIWVGSNVNADGSAALTGLPVLEPGQSATLTIPEREGAGHWRGTFFARQGCSGDDGSTFHCAVGDCGPYVDHCSTGQQPTSLAEFNFDPSDSLAPWYDVSYVDAVSAAVTITPNDMTPPETGECAAAGCAVDLLSACPAEDLVKDQGTGKALVCVNPNRDAKTSYSDVINQKCPTAYAWSKQDAEPGNRTMYQCTKCSRMTVTFNGANGPSTSDPGTTTTNRPATSTRKGVSLNPVDGASQALVDSKASWYFNWASSTGSVTKPDGVEYVPMIWGPGSVTDEQLGSAKNEGSELLGFNEPDSGSQANMTVEQALDLWPRLQSTGMRLGAPAVATGADIAGGWLDRFMQGAEQRGLRVDFIPLHWYGADFGPDAANQLSQYIQRVHDRYHKPIWLTEYGLIDFSQATPRYPSQQEETAFINSSTRMLDGLDYVERYAWFTLSTTTSPTGLYDGTTANAAGQAYRDAS
ncbi:glycosyl hydrolase [Streptomyces panaciradicis]|uniref:glycosyl hydrolase n=1 Tax=Streptomyces panaciradicis TaxID=1470261 RepID=UPI00201D2767|nr:glycosyl hydrolase [Streptomyces panaciradicis]MCL6669602.1 glycosyl hydrolase [Streptomyces panaciradicis]